MADKVRVNVTVDPDVAREARRRDEFNFSGFVNSTARAFLFGESTTVNEVVQQQEKQFVEERLAEVNETRAALRAELDRLEELEAKREAVRSDQESKWDDARAALLGEGDGPPRLDPDRLEVGNPAVENWAGKLGVTQTELLRQLGIDGDGDERRPPTESLRSMQNR